MKLYGEELIKELSNRKIQSIIRRSSGKSLRERAKELGMIPFEYLDWESGKDICPHEEYHKIVDGFHKPFFLVEMCTVCNHTKIIDRIETEEDFEKYKVELQEALNDTGLIKDNNE